MSRFLPRASVAIVALVAAVGCPASPPPSPPAPVAPTATPAPPPPAAEERPVKPEPAAPRFSIQRDTSVTSELRAKGVRADDAPLAFPCEAVDPKTYAPVEAVARFKVEGRPLLWIRPDRAHAVVDQASAGTLSCVDATRLRKDEEAAIGRVFPKAVAALGPRDVVAFLLHADVVRVYAHIGADVSIDAERRDGGDYEADVSGTHLYFTNKRNEGRLAFTVKIAANGAVTVRGR